MPGLVPEVIAVLQGLLAPGALNLHRTKSSVQRCKCVHIQTAGIANTILSAEVHILMPLQVAGKDNQRETLK